MAKYPENIQETLDTLALFPDRADRIQVLISLADRYEPVPERIATRPYEESHRVKGCESEVFVWGMPRDDGTLDFQYAVENPQGVSAMVLAVLLGDLSGTPLSTVATLPCEVIYEIFGNELSMGKSMGLMGMITATVSLARQGLAGEAAAD